MKILTVLKSGGVWTPKDVNHLYFWCSRYAKRFFSFYCLTDFSQKEFDSKFPIKAVKLVTDMTGWWSKLEVFRNDLPLGDVSWYMDLDVVPISDYGHMYETTVPKEFLVLKDLDGSPFSTRMMKWTSDIDTNSIFNAAWRYWVENKLNETNWPQDKDKVFVEDVLTKMGISVGYLEDKFPEKFVPYNDCLSSSGVPGKAAWLLFDKGKTPKDLSLDWYLNDTRKNRGQNGQSNFGRGPGISAGVR